MSLPAALATPRRARFPAPSAAWVAGAALVGLAILIQLRFGMMADVAWLIDADERWLGGAVFYRDIVEPNPPASLLLYLPAVAAARVLGLPSEALVSAFGFGAAGAAIALSAIILRGQRELCAPLTLAAIAALLVLPGQTFCERDHLAAVFGVPFLALALARAEGMAVAAPLALLAGLGAGAMVAIKPPYAAIPALLAVYQAGRSGWRPALKSPEYYAAAALALAYAASVGLLFPDYVANELPFNVDVYVAVREPLAKLAASPGALAALMIGATAALAAGERVRSPAFAVPGLAALGAMIAYVAQGKGWVYQAIPAMMYATLAAGFALGETPRRTIASLAAGAAAAAVVVPLAQSLGLGLAIGALVGVATDAALFRGGPLSLARVAPFATAAAIGAACGLCTIERPLTPALESALAGLGPHLRIGAISEDEGLGFPMVRRLHAIWAMRSHSLIVTAGVRRLLDEHPGDAGLAARLKPYAERDKANLLEDIAAQRPDALLVGPLKTRLHAALFADPAVHAAMADYHRVAVEERPDYSAELWLRKDFSGER